MRPVPSEALLTLISAFSIAMKSQSVRKRKPTMPIESFDEPRYNLPYAEITFDPFAVCMLPFLASTTSF